MFIYGGVNVSALEPKSQAESQHYELLFMRHPQTEGNVQRRFIGQLNSPLSEKGKLQRQEAEDALLAWKPERILCSPLDRCRAIAEPVAEKLGIDLELDERVLEINFGKLEGKTYEEVQAAGLHFPWEAELNEFEDDADCESLAQMHERISHFCSDLIAETKKAEFKRIAVISHGGVIRLVLGACLKIAPQDVWYIDIDNVQSCLFEMRGPHLYLKAVGLKPSELAGRNS